jgi:hypothetical protein
MNRATVVVRSGIAAFVLAASAVVVWRLSPGQAAARTAVTIAIALLLFETLSIIQTYMKRRETMDKVLRAVTGLNLVLLLASLITFSFNH